MALEEAGELEEAARVFEHAGEHGQAALLRLEHARTLRDPEERLDVLREGCARNPGSTTQGRTLHLALAEALLEQVVTAEVTAQRRALELEAARALDEADEAARAGELYEGLGLLRKAASAYERGGEVARLELVLEVLERLTDRSREQKTLLRDIDEAVAQGQRRYARELMLEHLRVHTGSTALAVPGTPAAATTTPPPALVARHQFLSAKLLDRDRVDLGWAQGRTTAVRMGPTLEIGRSPTADLSLPGARLSRHHVQLRVDNDGDRPRLVAIDQGSRIGTFWEGEALEPGLPTVLDGAGELGLGMAAALEVVPVRGSADAVRGALVRRSEDPSWVLFLPAGGPLVLAPDIRVPARIAFDRGLVTFDLAKGVGASLGETSLDPGSHIEFMLGDRLCLVGAPLCLEVLG